MTEYDARARVAPLPEWFPKFPTLRLLGRVISGRRIYGGKRKGYWTNGRVAAVRWSVVAWVALTSWLASMSLTMCMWYLILVGVSLLVWALGQLAEVVKTWWLRDKILNPLHVAYHEPQNIVGWPDEEKPARYLHVPVGWNRGDGKTVKIELRPGAANTAEKRDQFIAVTAATMGATIKPVDVTWRQSGKRPYVLIRPAFPPPSVAWFGDHIPRIEEARKPGEFVAGLSDHNRLVKVSLRSHPHIGVAARTGRGKTQVLALGSCQLLHDGAVGAFLDPKGASMRCFMDMPNTVYAGEYDAAHELILKLGEEFKRRKGLLTAWKRGTGKPDIGPRIVIVIEEADSLMEGLRIWWRTVKQGEGACPSVSTLLWLRNMGREYLMNQFMVSQSGSARAAGTGDGRSQFDPWFISADKATWDKVTARGVPKPPPISPVVGRWHRYQNGDVTEVQCFGFEDPADASDDEKMEEARAYALSGTVTPVPENLKLVSTIQEASHGTESTSGASRSYATNSLGDTEVRYGPEVRHSVPEVRAPHLWLVPADRPRDFVADALTGVYDEEAPTEVDTLMTLSEACSAGVIPLKLNAAKQASGRHGFPSEVLPRRQQELGAAARQYRRSELEDWARKRNARLTVGASHA